jgi:hypothetical protein
MNIILQIHWHIQKFPNSLLGIGTAVALLLLLGAIVPQSSGSIQWGLKPQPSVLLLNRRFIVCMPVRRAILYWLLWRTNALVISSAANPKKNAQKNACHQILVYYYNPEMKQYSSHLNSTSSPHPEKVRQVRPNIKNMLVILLDCKALLIRNLVLQIKRFTSNTTGKVCKVCKSKSAKNDQKDGWTRTEQFTNMSAHTFSSLQKFLVAENPALIPCPP